LPKFKKAVENLPQDKEGFVDFDIRSYVSDIAIDIYSRLTFGVDSEDSHDVFDIFMQIESCMAE
jgi:hypothetical protein